MSEKLKLFLKEFDELNKKFNLWIEAWNYAICGSWPLAVRWIKDLNDLDVLVTQDIINKLRENYLSFYIEPKNLYDIWNIELWCWILDNITLNRYIQEAENIDWYYYISLDNTIELKEKLWREKDIKDLELINNYLSK